MSDLTLTPSTRPPPVHASRPADPPKPPKASSDHRSLNDTTSSHGPAVVLSGAFAKPADKGSGQSSVPQGGSPPNGGQPAQTDSVALGQRINHVL